MGNMAACGGAKSLSTTKINTFMKDYALFCVQDNNDNSKKGASIDIQQYENKLLEHIKTFNKNKKELEKINPTLYNIFFDKKDSKKNTEVDDKMIVPDGIGQDDEDNFYYFFNKRNFKEVRLYQSYIIFPKFSTQSFPEYKSEISCLTKIVINNSTRFGFQEIYDQFLKLKNLKHLELVNNKIEVLSIHFIKMSGLQTLSLRRNKLRTFPDLRGLKLLAELDLSENEFTKFPESLIPLPALEKINLNMNHLDTVNYPNKNQSIKYLYLANNQIKEIPQDILNLEGLKHIALDGNQISEIKDTMFKDIPKERSYYIGISNNLLSKQKNIYGDIFEVPIISQGRNDVEVKKEEVEVIAKPVEENKATQEYEKKDSPSNEQDEKIKYKDPKHYIEKKINEELIKFLQNKKENATKGEFINQTSNYSDEQIESIRAEYFLSKLPELIQNGQINEIGKFGSTELKIDLKKAYALLKQKKELDDQKDLPSREKTKHTSTPTPKTPDNETPASNSKTPDDQHRVKNNAFEMNNNGGLTNLKFLNSLHEVMTLSLPRIFLYNLRNFDKGLFFSFRGLILDEADADDLILVLSEMKLFLTELINFYKNKFDKTNSELEYDVKILTETNVIYKIFKNKYTIKMLYTMGLSNIIQQEYKTLNETKNIEVLKFLIDNSSHSKQKMFESFLGRFINLLKTHKIDYLSLLTD